MKIWIHIDGQQLGPYDLNQLPLGQMTAETPVWYDGLERWTPASEAPITAPLFSTATGEVSPSEAADAAEETPAEAPELPGQQQNQPIQPRHISSEKMEEQKCPPTYLIWSILLTICCCNPLGIVPIITGAQVNSRFNNMDFEGAKRASDITEWWVIICFVIGLMMLPFTAIIYL